MQSHQKQSCKIMQIMHITITIIIGSKNHEKCCMICRGIHNKRSKIMQNHAKWSCKILQIMHITITIMTGSKNHEKWCIIHGGVLLNLKLWWTLQPLKGKANNGGKTCFPRCSQIFFFDKTLFYHKMNHFKLKNPCGSLRQFFFPKRGKPKFTNCTLCFALGRASHLDWNIIGYSAQKRCRYSFLLFSFTPALWVPNETYTSISK